MSKHELKMEASFNLQWCLLFSWKNVLWLKEAAVQSSTVLVGSSDYRNTPLNSSFG